MLVINGNKIFVFVVCMMCFIKIMENVGVIL